jgi:hypothetical protein
VNPDRSRQNLFRHADVLASRVLAGAVNDSAVESLLKSLANHWCDPTARSNQLTEALDRYRSQIECTK